MTAIVLIRLVPPTTLVLPVRPPVPKIMRGTPLPLSTVDRHLEALIVIALIKIGRFPLRSVPTCPMIVSNPSLNAGQSRLGLLTCVMGWPAGTETALTPQTLWNLLRLAPVAFATLVSPPHTWNRPRQATPVTAPPLLRTGMRLPVLTVRRKLLEKC